MVNVGGVIKINGADAEVFEAGQIEEGGRHGVRLSVYLDQENVRQLATFLYRHARISMRIELVARKGNK